MPKEKKTKMIAIRLYPDTLKQLDILCQAFNTNRTDLISNFIQGQYDKLQGSPIMLEMLKTMNDLTAKLSEQAKALEQEQLTNGKQ